MSATHLPLHTLDPGRPPVVLLGGINLVRALGMAGIPVIVATADAEEPALWSRYCVGRVALPGWGSPESMVAALVSLGDRLAGTLGCRVPLMYGSDDALELIYAHRERLQRYYLFLAAESEVGEALIAKDRFQMLAQRRALPVPATLHWDTTLAQAACEVLVKPRVKRDWHDSALCRRIFAGDGKALVFASGAAARGDPDIALFHDDLVFQEYIPGDDPQLWSYHGFADKRGEVLASFVGRKVRTYPIDSGESAFIELAREESLEAIGREIARRCPIQGVFKMDFKRDARDGRWLLLEINARFNLWHYLGARNGVNLTAVAYNHLVHGAAPRPARHRTTWRWLSLALDYKAYRQLRSRGSLTFAGWAASIVFSRNIYSIFSWSDPLPWVRHMSARVARKCRRSPARALAALRQWLSTAS